MSLVHEQQEWTAEAVSRHLDRPIPYRVVDLDTETAELGLKGENVYWAWKPYEDRLPAHQADYDRILVSIYHHGVRQPVICWENHVLIGQSRVEIARRLGIKSVPALQIEEDARLYWKHDIARIDRHLKPVAGEWQY